MLATAVYALLWTGSAAHWNWLTTFDTAMLQPLHRYGAAHQGWVTAWDVFCDVLGPLTFRVVTLVVIVVALVRRLWRTALFLFLSVELSGLLTEIAKNLVDRPRPVTALAHAPSTSFPSGHALGVLVGVAALLLVAWPYLRDVARDWLVATGVVVTVAIGVGRVVLNVHHPSDVLAGWALGYVYLVACVLIVRPWRELSVRAEIPAVPGSAR